MLLMTQLERVPQIDPAPEKVVAVQSAKYDYGATIILHDSFYQTYLDEFQALYPGGRFFGLSDEAVSESPITTSDTIIVEFVERSFFDRLKSLLSWNGSLAKAILARNEARAKGCEGLELVQASGGETDLNTSSAKQAAVGQLQDPIRRCSCR